MDQSVLAVAMELEALAERLRKPPPEKRTVKVWINVYEDGSFGAFKEKWQADEWYRTYREACIEREITYEVWEGL